MTKIDFPPKDNDKKPKTVKSKIAQFHDQKSGGFDDKTGIMYEPDVLEKDYNKWLDFLAYAEKRLMKESEKTPKYDLIKDTLEKIDQIKLGEFSIDDPEHENILEKQKTQAKQLIDTVISKAIEYYQYVLAQQALKAEGDVKAIEISDSRRRYLHNALIDALRIANRYIYRHFAALNAEQLAQFEEQEEEKGHEVIDVVRLPFGEKVFVPKEVNL